MDGKRLFLLRTVTLSRLLNRSVSQYELGTALGLNIASAARRVRKWEKDEEAISGPTILALMFLEVACADSYLFDRYWRKRFK